MGVVKPGFLLGKKPSLTLSARGLAGARGARGCFTSLSGFLHGAFLFQALKARRSLTGSAHGGRWSRGGAVRAKPAPGPTRRVGQDAKPLEAAGSPRVLFSRFWDQSLTSGAL